MSNTTFSALTGSAGGTNIPLADMSAFAGDTAVVVRDPSPSNATPYKTITVAALAALMPGGRTEFNVILESRADLLAAVGPPVAGIFTLISGSYFIKTSFSLNANEGLQVAGGIVFIQGGGPAGKIVTGGSLTIPTLQVTAGTCILLSLGLTQAVTNGVVWDCGGDVNFATVCVFTQPANTTNPAVQTSGTSRLTLSSCRITSQGPCLRHAAAGQRLTAIGCRFESTNGTCLEMVSANGWFQVAESVIRVTAAGATGQCAFINAATGTMELDDNEIAQLGTAQPAILVSSGGIGSLAIRGGEMQCSGAGVGTGVSIAAAITRSLTADGVNVLNMALFVAHTSGTVAHCRVSQCVGHTGVLTAVSWLVANIPTRGLFELMVSWNAATASVFTGHAQNDARVMRRSNMSSTVLMSETGAVP